ncbi:SLC13 family permease [Hyperthermus butylicus]|uniref:Anion permease, ArsB/NhaD n=1 Tax=Hyperthermus butylicus (strain DSM 5456 / JCM 9403 / PLM1-5) TaxID=415426 RepID=A2BKE7_HYPBU|nr:SLC13 family permease [Hyperthermus butylicus]ABM80458.1 Anion permease, ArsB/NhaD [Hyperthermus butylicus DSM 5456]
MVSEALSLLVFLATIVAINARIIDETVVALVGLTAMVVLAGYRPDDAFHAVDWNVIMILLGMWMITAYLNRAGFSEAVVRFVSRRVRDYRLFLVYLMLIAGFISMFVDNVLVILLLGSMVIEAARRNGANIGLAVLMIGFSANFMGTALLMGDLPPQLLHSVAGAEFLDFIWSRGKPSSFPLLTITFLAVTGLMYFLFIRREPSMLQLPETSSSGVGADRRLLNISVFFFAATVAAMALRPLLGVPLGFITIAGASLLALTVEVWRRLGGRVPSFEEIIGDVEWRALMFYALLFSLVGGLEESGVLRRAAEHLQPYVQAGGVAAYTVFYWVTGLLSTMIEHDALLLTFLYIVRNAANLAGVDAWPLYWAMAWAATLGSNATIVAAPALYVAVTMAEKAGHRISPREFLRYSLTYATASLVIHYLLTLPLWGT